MSTIPKVRTALYKSAQLLGWISAAQNGTLLKRTARVLAGKATSRLLFGKLFR